jgi:hypothetical protein
VVTQMKVSASERGISVACNWAEMGKFV